FFCADYNGPYLPDAYCGFIAMLQHWGIPCPGEKYSSLNGLTLAQFCLARAWEENDTAKCCFDGQAVAHGWEHDDTIGVGIVAAVSAAKLISQCGVAHGNRR